MKKFYVCFIVLSLAAVLVSCQSAEQKEQTQWEKAEEEATQKAMDNAAPKTYDRKEDVIDSSDAKVLQESSPVTWESIDSDWESVDLYLPIEVTERVAGISDRGSEPRGAYVSNENIVIGYTERSYTITTQVKDVRSFYEYKDTYFYIKNDNSLWTAGSNKRGFLGDGTDTDKTVPVKILDSVATVGVIQGLYAYAIGVSKFFWIWGGSEYTTPFLVTDNVVAVYDTLIANNILLLKSDGCLYEYHLDVARTYSGGTYKGMLATGQRIIGSDAFTIPQSKAKYYDRYFWIDPNNALWFSRHEGGFYDGETVTLKICESDVLKVFDFSTDPYVNINCLFIKTDNSLWGYGLNEYAELGDGAKSSHLEKPVKIAEDVIDVNRYCYLKSNGDFYIWNADEPMPKKALGNIYCILGIYDEFSSSFSYNVLDKDGNHLSYYSFGNGESSRILVAKNVKLPRTINFSDPSDFLVLP